MTTPSLTVFSGVLERAEDRFLLRSGGLVAELVLASDETRENLAAVIGQTISFTGQQTVARIEQAKLLQEVGAAETSTVSQQARFAPVFAAIDQNSAALTAIPNVVSVRPGFRRAAGHLTSEPAIVVSVCRKLDMDELAPAAVIPRAIESIPVDVVVADPREIVGDGEGRAEAATATPATAVNSLWREILSEAPVSEAARATPKIGYKPPKGIKLKACKIRDVLCHIGPDAGWSTLKAFLLGTKTSLSVTMYEMTADYIIKELVGLGRDTPDAKLSLVLQENTNETSSVAKLKRAWNHERFNYAKAVVSGPHRIFANSFHSKVAVQDSEAMWLSSGNWSPHSQPQVPAGPSPTIYRLGNREWHVVIKNPELSEIFEGFILYDLDTAAKVAEEEVAPLMPELFVPESALIQAEARVVQPAPFATKHIVRSAEDAIKVQPLMTPDNYGPAILELINSAEDTLYMQYSYIRGPKNNDLYRDLLKAVAGRMKKGVDVRVIVDTRNEADADVDLVLALGWDSSRWRRQVSPVHNKGILVDGHLTVVGSQNWSSDGTQINRDASLIFDDAEIAAYYDAVFQFDWANLTKPIGAQETAPIVAQPGDPTPVGMVRVPWNAWYG
ncbi:phospholipase D-like domain-containing protein [Bradyrhizobium sp. DASA03068]|uniref:phospholipase D-like domain-containing protein n=1 Tax=Bradyrhizobium sp. BLXBL-01 TaxID=3395915 RepID=UPI003F6F8E03